jgi:hypothetical protein
LLKIRQGFGAQFSASPDESKSSGLMWRANSRRYVPYWYTVDRQLKRQGFQQNDDGRFFGLADKVLFDTDADVVKTESRTVIERVGHALVVSAP